MEWMRLNEANSLFTLCLCSRGTVDGAKPYTPGESCKACDEGQTCENKMCKGERKPTPAGMTAEMQKQVVDMHNKERETVQPTATNMQAMVIR